jgi:peptide-methionine (S)-S-oxide reductase
MKQRWILSLAFAALIGGSAALAQTAGQSPDGPQGAEEGLETAIFAGGCFWCVEEAFDKVEGVVETTSGYTGGTVEDPTYQQVSAGGTGHAEAVQVRYDPAKVDYVRLLDVFWHNVDPFDAGGQFCDRGGSYRSAIFVATDEQERLAEASKKDLADRFDRPIATGIVPADVFYPAEDYHQDYHAKNPLRYKFYKWNCGRAQRLEEIWGEPASS